MGSWDANECLRPIFSRPGWRYVGADLALAANVDLVLTSPYDWPEIASESFDVVVSSSCLEHVPKPWRWMPEIARVVRRGGLVYCCVPGVCPYHPSPLDCWRVFPDGLKALFEDAGLAPIRVFQQPSSEGGERTDTVGIARRPD